jgi:hypothetical protein
MARAETPTPLCPPGSDGIIADKPGFFGMIAEDLRCAMERDPAATSKLSIFSTYSGLHALWAHHFEHWLWKNGAQGLARFLAQITAFLLVWRSTQVPSLVVGCSSITEWGS